ncbi:hypothetical protein Tco_1283362 [Tanacetum coccineum]
MKSASMILAYSVALEVMENDEDLEPKSVHECKNKNDWPKRQVFGPVVRTPEGVKPVGELPKAVEYLKKEFEMKDLGKTKFCLRLQIEHLKNGILVHQNPYIDKLLKRFYMDKSHPLSTPMVVRTLDVEKDPFRPLNDDDEILGPEVPYLSALGALLFLTRFLQERTLQQLYMKIMQHALLNLRMDTSKVTEASIFNRVLFTHDLRKSGDIIVQKVPSSENLPDLFTNTLPTTTFKKLVQGIGMRRLNKLK